MKVLFLLVLWFLGANSEAEVSLTQKSPEDEKIEEINTLRSALSQAGWRDALKHLTQQQEDPSTPIKIRARISLILGMCSLHLITHYGVADFFSGFLPADPESIFPPRVELARAFYHYAFASEHVVPELERAQYMLSFLLMYHPEIVPEEYLNFKVSLLPPEGSFRFIV